jgi:hypothetical protein
VGGEVAGSSTTTFSLIFIGLMVLGAMALLIVALQKPIKQNLSAAAAQQYGEDLVGITEIVAKDMVPRFPHLTLDQLTELVITAVQSKSKADVKLYAVMIRQTCERIRAQSAGTPMDESKPTIDRWTD